jgi:hypothetical protein
MKANNPAEIKQRIIDRIKQIDNWDIKFLFYMEGITAAHSARVEKMEVHHGR